MSLYFVTYELRDERDYPQIIEELENLGAKRVLNSQWCLKQENTTAKELRDHLVKFIDNDDGLIVNQSTAWASIRTKATPNDI